MTRTTIALAAALLMGTATVALAETARVPPSALAAGAMQSTPMRVESAANMSMRRTATS